MTDRDKRRAVLLSILGSGVIATQALPERWTKPVVEQIVLPAHAAELSDEIKCDLEDDDCCDEDCEKPE